MQLTPEIKAQLEEQKKQCIFCKLISGEQEAKTVFQDDKTIAMLDINPAIKGHTLFLLKEHYPIMPYIPADEFKHYFGLIPGMCEAVKSGMVTTGVNVFIANGGIAGQQSPHFLIHLFPRENGDGFFNFMFDKKGADLDQEKVQMLAHNFPIMMNNHFGRNPAEWHQGSGEKPAFLTKIYETSITLYEDEKVLVILPQRNLVPGHMEIHSKVEEHDISKLSIEDSAHLFYTASFAATAVFEGLGAQGTNIILKSGTSDDNPDGKLVLHILPRMPDDGLDKMLWKPKPPKYKLEEIQSRIKDHTWKVKYKDSSKKESKKETIIVEPEVIKINADKRTKDSKPEIEEDEIGEAIKGLRG
tara:strand:- start:150 stop:1220 length:1071 start_codon:yes stop_codon:yes gene_type:complete